MAIKIKVKVTPNAHQDKICGYIGKNILKIKIKAKPIDGKANSYLLKFLSKELDIPQSNFSIIQGKTSRIKMLEISNLEKKEFIKKLSL